MNEIDKIIALLEWQYTAIGQALETLRGVSGGAPAAKNRPGRPPGETAIKASSKKKRVMSAEGRQRQIKAMKAYWATKKATKKVGKKATKKATKRRPAKKVSMESA